MSVSSLYHATTQLFYQLANAFFWPVAAALLVLFALSIVDLGALIAQAWRRRSQPHTDTLAVARVLLQGLDARDGRDPLEGFELSPVIRRFWTRVRSYLEVTAASGRRDDLEHLDLWLDEAFQEEEMAVTSQLDLGRVLIRIGPMLGLAGTIIPLGPALESLLGGNMADMVGHLVIGFGAVVVGLVMSGIAYFTTLVRERWMRRELKNLESLCELIMRGIRARQRDEATARHREVEYAGV